MLPSLTERDIEAGLRSFIEREFPIATPAFQPDGVSIVDSYIEKKGNFIQGPWLEIRRPFRTIPADMKAALPYLSGKWGIASDWVPYAHQLKAFERLASPNPKSTIVATGTGSGKTECFLLPVLDAVLQMNAENIPGIKAIVIYPMNALATDQARRFASMCEEIVQAGGPRLTVGLYTGSPGSISGVMKGENCITDRKVLRKNPPDILLTNYKMLDFLLLRREDRALWRTTTAKSLRYLIVDELHTFDGAQGTDLACLIRRLRDFLNLGDGLACVGTSATLGGSDGLGALQQYASDVFGADFSHEESIIKEDRLSLSEYLDTFGPRHFEGRWPTPYQFKAFQSLSRACTAERFASEAYSLWFGRFLSITENDKESWTQAALKVGQSLPHLEAFQRLMSTEDEVVHVEELAHQWKRELDVLKGFSHEEIVLLIRSLAALVSMARLTGAKGRIIPFLTVRVQFWLRELTKMLATVEHAPRLVAAADLTEHSPLALPLVTCRDCNATGWGTTVNVDKITVDPDFFYRNWFAAKPECAVLYPVKREELSKQLKLYAKDMCYLNTKSLELSWIGIGKSAEEVWAKTLPDEHGKSEFIVVRRPNLIKSTKSEDGRYVRMSTSCPWCGSENTMRLFGARSTTLSSALFGHLNSSTANDDHKLIAFSDSVQDAAHRAGFIEARNYLYTVRQAAAGVIRSIRPGERQSLDAVLNRLTDHWVGEIGAANKMRMSNSSYVQQRADDIAAARFVTTFVPSDMLWRKAWRDFADKASELWQPLSAGGFNPKVDSIDKRFEMVPALFINEDAGQKKTDWGRFVDDVKARLRWEVFIELTLRSHSGRTLELAGIGAAVPDPYLIKEAALHFQTKVVELVGGLRDKPVEDFERFITGFLMHQKSRGAFDVSAIEGLSDFSYFVETGDDWIFNRSLSLPNYGKRFRPPAPLAMRPLKSSSKGFFDSILPTSSRSETWYSVWLTSIFGAELDVVAGCEDIYSAMIDVLCSLDMVHVIWMKKQTNTPVYMLNPQTWYIARSLKRAVCPSCGRWHVFEGTAENCTQWEHMHCLSKKCNAETHVIEPFGEEEDLYQGTPYRATAREHTANVPSQERGRIERSFIHGKEPWDVNLLSATPTLEMGIDIGDLSSVLLSSMPPKQASYLQRIGRAGRRDGNALAMTICGSDQHAQYFWADPEKMLAGAVEPPGVFLHAMAVLERQLFALSLTRWMSQYPEAQIPTKIDDIIKPEVLNAESYTPESFPLGFLDYVTNEAEGLHQDFCSLFTRSTVSGSLSPLVFTPDEKERLRDYLVGSSEGRSSLRDRLIGKLRKLELQRESYVNKRREYQNALKRRQNAPQDEARDNDIEELKQNIASLTSLIAAEFANKQTLNMLTDEGLLPNYAFPEEGITIDSMIIKLRNRGAKDKNDTSSESKDHGVYKRFTFQRAASSGLTEVAPESNFYINEYVLHIDQVELADDELKRWRFCPNCQYSEHETLDERSSACPRCGSPEWREESQARQVLPLRTVYAWADLKNDRIKDDDESRRPLLQTKKLLVDFSGKAARKSFVMDAAGGFGFEYISSVTLRDFNFGPIGRNDAQNIEVGGVKLPAPGFTVCKGCGRIKQDEQARNKRPQHDFDCPYAKQPEKAEWLDGLILYREYQSEALRIRLPGGLLAASYGPEVLSASITAALRLGLKRYFHGSVDHLRFTQIEEPQEGSEKLYYIVVYDTVPGGTGYLKELMSDPGNLIGVFREALDVMVNCDCGGDPEAQGCYKCVYQYRDAASRKNISKLCAIDVLSELTASNKVVRPGVIDTRDNTDGDSELEVRFIRALGKAGLVAEMKRCQEGMPHYLVKMQSGKLWRMDLQVDMTGDAPSRPDFVLRPWKESERTPENEMAIFTDGWRYHADIVREDCAKRQSILNTGRHVWTLSWHDVPDVLSNDDSSDSVFCDSLLIRPAPKSGKLFDQYKAWQASMQQRGLGDFPPFNQLIEDWVENKNSFDRLLQWMNNPEKAQKAAQALAFFRGMQSVVTDDMRRLPVVTLKGMTAQALAATDNVKRHVFGLHQSADKGWASVHDFMNTYRTAFYVDPDIFTLHKDEPAACPASQSLRSFWASVNMASLAEDVLIYPQARPEDGSDPDIGYQMPWARATDEIASKPGRILPTSMEAQVQASDADRKAETEALWEEAKSLLPEELLSLADELKAMNVTIDLNNIGYESIGGDGEVVSTFELYWPDQKLAVLFEPLSAPQEITALDAAMSAHELALAIKATLTNNTRPLE